MKFELCDSCSNLVKEFHLFGDNIFKICSAALFLTILEAKVHYFSYPSKRTNEVCCSALYSNDELLFGCQFHPALD